MDHEGYAKAANYWKDREEKFKEMEPERLMKEIESYVTSRRTCALGTGYGTSVRVSPVDYTYRDGVFLIYTEGGDKFLNLEHNDNVSLAVFDQNGAEPGLKGLQVQGKGIIVDSDTEEYAAPLRDRGMAEDRIKWLGGFVHLLKVVPERMEFLNTLFQKDGYGSRQTIVLKHRRGNASRRRGGRGGPPLPPYNASALLQPLHRRGEHLLPHEDVGAVEGRHHERRYTLGSQMLLHPECGGAFERIGTDGADGTPALVAFQSIRRDIVGRAHHGDRPVGDHHEDERRIRCDAGAVRKVAYRERQRQDLRLLMRVQKSGPLAVQTPPQIRRDVLVVLVDLPAGYPYPRVIDPLEHTLQDTVLVLAAGIPAVTLVERLVRVVHPAVYPLLLLLLQGGEPLIGLVKLPIRPYMVLHAEAPMREGRGPPRILMLLGSWRSISATSRRSMKNPIFLCRRIDGALSGWMVL